MRRRAIAIGAVGFAASALLLVLAMADVERTTLSFLAALAWLAGSGGALAALLHGQRMSLRGQVEILKRLDRLPTARDLRRLPKLEDLERLSSTRDRRTSSRSAQTGRRGGQRSDRGEQQGDRGEQQDGRGGHQGDRGEQQGGRGGQQRHAAGDSPRGQRSERSNDVGDRRPVGRDLRTGRRPTRRHGR